MTNTPARETAALESLLSERGYQLAMKGNAKPHEIGERKGAGHPAEFITYMQKCLDDARNAVYRGSTGHVECLPFVRKVGALALACLATNGAPQREGFEIRITGLTFTRRSPSKPAVDLGAKVAG
jgi:hypothetical protein